jgi:hypothetical protein
MRERFMLNTQQQALVAAVSDLDVAEVEKLLAEGVDPNFIIDGETGPLISLWSDTVFAWWEQVCEAYEAGQALSDAQKTETLQPYMQILEALIKAKVNLHLWDSEEIYGPLWDVASAACVPAVERLLAEQVNPNTKDEDDLTILSSISQLFFDCDFDEVNWAEALQEEKQVLELLRAHGAKMSKELD